MSPTDFPTDITRRQAVGAAGAAGAALLLTKLSGPGKLLETIGLDAEAQAATTSCVLSPAKTVGPYFKDEKLNRSDIRTDTSDGSVETGTQLDLTMVIVDAANGCAPIAGAQVDIWHANASGKYSDFSGEGTLGQTFLRGFQVTDANGQVKFTTVFPGWYSGRAVHIHFKIRANGKDFTSQLFFDPAVTSAIYTQGVYASRGQATTANSNDNIYGSDGAKLLVPLSESGGVYSGTFVAGVSGITSSSSGGGGTTTPTTNTVEAALSKAKFTRTKTGKRTLKLTFDIDEGVAVRARVSRDGKTIRKKTTTLKTGNARTLSLDIPRKTKRGKARLSLVYADAAGTKKTATRTITIPSRLG